MRLLAALDEDVRLMFSLNKDVDEDKRHLHCFRVKDVRWEGGLQLSSFDRLPSEMPTSELPTSRQLRGRHF